MMVLAGSALAVLASCVFPVATGTVQSDSGYATLRAISYRTGAGTPPYAAERCNLDLYYPKSKRAYATVVWFHGGGLTGGERSIPEELKAKGIAVVAASYRLAPKAKSPAYIEDAAAAVAWTFKNISRYGGTPDQIYVSGHSAGGYLALMVGLDGSWLKPFGIDPNRIAGLVPFSGQCITHFTIRAERGIPETRPVVGRFAPLFHVRGDAPPILLVTGDRNRELLGRYEENAYLWRMLKVAGHSDVELLELQGYDHGGMAAPAFPLLLRFLADHSNRGQ